MTAAVQPKFFDNYTKRPARVPSAVWHAARVLTLAATLAVAAALFLRPEIGLKLFWGVVIPSLPILLVFAPGLWRQVCPMAFLNQIPRMTGISAARQLPEALQAYAFLVAVAGFVGMVALRKPLLNHSGLAVGVGIVAVLVLAFLGGLFFKGRSGWCGTFCPLGPIQRTYGQAPLVVVRNGFCATCVGCQKNCYDFNPRAALFSDIYDEDQRYAGQRRLFMGLLPGLILGYFAQGPAQPGALWWQAFVMLAACSASAGLYGLAVSFLPVAPHRLAALFGGAAIAVFYWFAGPLLLGAVADLAGVPLPGLAVEAARGVGIVGALALIVSSARSARHYFALRGRSEAAKVDEGHKALKDRLGSTGGREVTDRASGVTFQVAGGVSLLDAIQAAGLKINYGCRSGVCGADAVAVCDGAEHLSPPGEDELATLRRLGLEGRARLACMCQVSGPVLIDRDPHSAPAAAPVKTMPPAVDRAREAGISRVVIVGNGVAGMSAAEALRRESLSVAVTLVTNEPGHFYNRMAIGRLIYDGTGMDGLQLVPDSWFTSNDVKVMRNTVAAAIDRPARELVLATGERLPYDRLILATGARPMVPTPDFLDRSNAFVLRNMDDARAIRDYIQRMRARRAVVIGGGVLGVEAADALHHLGLQVVILQRAERLMNAQLDEHGAAKLANYLESIGVQVVTNTSVARFEGRDAISVAWLSHGPRVRADLFVACLGIETNSFLAARAGLAVGRGIKVNATMQTSDPDIYAIGDVAEVTGAPGGLWPIGSAHAATAVSAMLGTAAPYAHRNVALRLKCDGIDLHSFGAVLPADGVEELTAAPDDPAWWRFNLRDGELVGALYVGPPNTGHKFAKLMQSPGDFAPVRDALRQGDLGVLRAAV